eukprot:g16989.t1
MPGRRARGWIKTYSRDSGWGFINCKEVDRDIFVSDCGRCLRALHPRATGDLLAVEAPLALGSSDGERLGEVVSEDVLSGMAWDAECRQVKLVAMEDLRTGQRVTRSYLDAAELLAPWPRRQELLLSGWGFRCGCARCVEESSNVTDTATTTEHLDLNRCAVGLPLDELVPQVRKAGKACQALGVPKVGTLQFLEGVLAKRRHANELLWLHGLGPPTPSEADEEEEEEEVTASARAKRTPVARRKATTVPSRRIFELPASTTRHEDSKCQCAGAHDER